MTDVEVIQLIKTRLLRRGKGDDSSDPIRQVEQYWNMDGSLLFEFDTWNGEIHSPKSPNGPWMTTS